MFQEQPLLGKGFFALGWLNAAPSLMHTDPETNENLPSQLRRWYRCIPGRLVLQAERNQLEALLPSLMGNRIAQVGCVGSSALLTGSTMPHRIVVDGDVRATDIDPDVYAQADALPFETESLDVLVLPHTLEWSGDPQKVLQESHRVLAPEGHLVILGFNPWGLWSFWRGLRKRRTEVPWCGSFRSPSQVCAWMVTLDFHVVRTRYFFFRPPLQHEASMRALSFLKILEGRHGIPLSGLYLVMAQKRVVAMTPISLRWKGTLRPRMSSLCWVKNNTKD